MFPCISQDMLGVQYLFLALNWSYEANVAKKK